MEVGFIVVIVGMRVKIMVVGGMVEMMVVVGIMVVF